MAKHKVTVTQPARITDGVDTNNFGVLFHSTAVIEEFQKRSGMEGAYTTEYQHHYLSLIARLEADGQIMDLCIPLCMYNYHQEVGGASVEFNLGEVGTANNDAQEMAMTKYNEFVLTPMYQVLVSMGFENFVIEGMHSVHAHPNGINRFSGTDLRTDINHPGVNFPLNTGTNVANFASIIQHKENHAQLIHTEYRMFNGTENGDKVYKKGRTLTVVKGFEVPEPAPYVAPEPGLIDKLFGTRPPAPPKPATPKDRPDYFLEDGFANADKLTFDNLKDELMKMWKECPFEADVSMVLKTNVLKGRGRLLSPHGTVQHSHGYSHGGRRTGKHNVAEINEGLFGAWARTDGNEPETETLNYAQKRLYLLNNGYTHQDLNGQTMADIQEIYDQVKIEELEEKEQEEPPFWEMKAYLVKQECYTWMEMNGMTPAKVSDAYWLEKLDELEDESAGIVDVDEAEDDLAMGEMILELLDLGFTAEDIRTWSEDEVRATHDVNFPKEEKADKEKMQEYLIEIGFTMDRVALMDDNILIETYELNMNKAGNETSIEEADGDDNFTRKEMENMLISDNIMEGHKLKAMVNQGVVDVFTESYGMMTGGM